MLTLELSMFDLILTVVVIVLVLMFVTLLLKLDPSRGRKYDEEEIQVVSGSGSELDPQFNSKDTLSLQEGSGSTSPRNQEFSAHQSRQTSKKKGVSRGLYPDPLTMSQNPVDMKCPHEFGYLKGLPKNRPIPEECFGCPKIVECLVDNKKS